MNDIETINIWKRSHDGRFSICILSTTNGVHFTRNKITFDTLDDVIKFLMRGQTKRD